jgi:hypothetical protein
MSGSTPVVWMILGSLASCALVLALGGPRVWPEVVVGMAAPLASVVVTWPILERTHAASPERLTGMLIASFAIKMVLFGAYAAAALAMFSMRPKPFIATFTGYYVALHAAEALLLKRLLAPHS